LFADDYQSQTQVLVAVDANQKELHVPAETVEQGSSGQEGPPTAAALKHCTVQSCNNESREKVFQASSEFSLVLIKKPIKEMVILYLHLIFVVCVVINS